MVTELFASRIQSGELGTFDPVEAMHLFLALCTGRFWSPGLLCIGPPAKKIEVERHIDQVIEGLLSMYSPRTRRNRRNAHPRELEGIYGAALVRKSFLRLSNGKETRTLYPACGEWKDIPLWP